MSTFSVRVATLNVRGLRFRMRQAQLQRLLFKQQLDLVAVQGTRLCLDGDMSRALDPFLKDYDFCVSHSVGTSVDASCFYLSA